MADRILKSQTYLYLLAQLTEATVNKEKAEKDYDLFLSEKNAATYHYEEALDELSKIYGISKERIRQIELNSIKKIRKTLSLA